MVQYFAQKIIFLVLNCRDNMTCVKDNSCLLRCHFVRGGNFVVIPRGLNVIFMSQKRPNRFLRCSVVIDATLKKWRAPSSESNQCRNVNTQWDILFI